MKEKTFNKIKIIVAENYKEMSRIAAKLILEKIDSKEKINMLVPSGLTPKGVYKILRKNPKIFKKVRFFNMDEYCMDNCSELIPQSSPASFRKFMKDNLFGKNKVESYFPSEDDIKKKGSYDRKIKEFGGIDLCLDALGMDGHTLGFNFPGASFNSVTRLVKINSQTRKINKQKTGHETPRYAVSTGLKTGMQSKEIIFLVSGKQKAGILRKVVYAKKPTKRIPATVLKLHPNCKWIIDKEAASEL